jgi:ribosomal protein S18 acetylase RimI-like enzyme
MNSQMKISTDINRAVYDIYSRCFPDLLADFEHFERVLKLTDPRTEVIVEKSGENDDENGDKKIIGFTVLRGNTIMLLCVEEAYRRRGVGGGLLTNAENMIFKNADTVVLGHAEDCYLFPGAPAASEGFFTKRGYAADWNSIDLIIDMDAYAKKASASDIPVYTDDDIIFRLIESEGDREKARICGDLIDGWGEFYASGETCIIAENAKTGEFAGGILVDRDCPYNLTYPGAGGFGCVGVLDTYRNRGIGMKLCTKALEILLQTDVKQCYIGYTWLDKWYGKLTAKTCARYFMGEKKAWGNT